MNREELKRLESEFIKKKSENQGSEGEKEVGLGRLNTKYGSVRITNLKTLELAEKHLETLKDELK